jgi:radical SAM protein with 4Fe4S-binding SPASM domain
MKNSLSGLGNINIELTSRCNKSCWMCGRRKVEKEYPDLALEYGDMDFELVKKIAEQLPHNIVVQFHNNGEALLYSRFGDAVRLFKKQVTNVVTNGKLLLEKAGEIIDNLDTIAISVIENDPESDEQYEIISKFLELKGDKKPFTILRLNGEVDPLRYEKFGLILATRIIHSPMGSFNYRKKNPAIPEIGICLDFLHHLAINSKGKVSICVRFDPKGVGVIGDAQTQSLEEIWNCKKRMEWLEHHKQGKRDKVPLCSYCQFWGVPTGRDLAVRTEKINEKEVFCTEREERH